MKENLDLRIQKTRQSLIDALFDTLKKKIVLKVVYVCKKAKICYNTFYRHFKNKNTLLEYSINDQLKNKLPIPLKLKPRTLKQFLFYLIDFFHQYVQENKDVICSCYNSKSRWKKMYFKVLIQTIETYVKSEIKQIYKYITDVLVNVWTENIVGGLFYLFVKMITNNTKYDNKTIKNCLVQLYNNIIKY